MAILTDWSIRETRELSAEADAAPKPAANNEVLDTVNAWAKAWSAKNVDAYLAFYARDFKTPGGEARPEWEKARRQRISAAGPGRFSARLRTRTFARGRGRAVMLRG